ncbi:MAG: FxLYD domain-containing protein [Pyrinomonadaceae bacterium]|nr:FxLYD domain-containing protein [Pyrinomonadaceae bacterium]
MKTCPKCKSTFSDQLNFCLEDGAVLIESQSLENENTLAYSQEPTLQLPFRQTNEENETVTQIQSGRQQFHQSPPRSNSGNIIAILFWIGVFLSFCVAGGFWYLFTERRQHPVDPPNIYGRSPSPVSTPTPKAEDNIKVEILEKVTDGSGKKFLKCKVTNISEKAVELSFVGLSFYKGDVKIRDGAELPELRILKPNQTIPVWINLYGTDGYTSVKVKEPISTNPVRKPEAELFPQLEFSQTEMKAESGYMSVNFRQYKTTYYKVSGIVENPKDEKISPKIFVLFYDANSEIVGISSTSSVNLEKGEKARFEVQEVEAEMFGKPKTFEIIAIAN